MKRAIAFVVVFAFVTLVYWLGVVVIQCNVPPLLSALAYTAHALVFVWLQFAGRAKE